MTEEQRFLLQLVLIFVAGMMVLGLIYILVGKLKCFLKTEWWQIILCVVLFVFGQTVVGVWLYQLYRTGQQEKALQQMMIEVEEYQRDVEEIQALEEEYYERKQSNDLILGRGANKQPRPFSTTQPQE